MNMTKHIQNLQNKSHPPIEVSNLCIQCAQKCFKWSAHSANPRNTWRLLVWCVIGSQTSKLTVWQDQKHTNSSVLRINLHSHRRHRPGSAWEWLEHRCQPLPSVSLWFLQHEPQGWNPTTNAHHDLVVVNLLAENRVVGIALDCRSHRVQVTIESIIGMTWWKHGCPPLHSVSLWFLHKVAAPSKEYRCSDQQILSS